MNDIFLLYLLMQADTIAGALGILATCLIAISLISWFVVSITNTTSNSSPAERENNAKACRATRWLTPIAIITFVIQALFPTTKTIAVMAGGHYAIEVAKSDTGKKVRALIDATLDKAVEKVSQ